MSTPDSNQWKEKYLTSLDDLESKEKAWERVEAIFRQALSRLALAVETPDKRLAAQLESLRHAVRKNATATQIGTLMEEISSSMLRLDQQRDGAEDVKSALSRIEGDLEKLAVPDGLKRETRELRKQLREARQVNDLKQALDAYSGYLNKVMTWLVERQQGEKDGLFGRLFGRKDANETKASLGEQAEAPEAMPTLASEPLEPESAPDESVERDARDSGADAPPSFNQVLFDLIHRLDLPEELSEQFQRVSALLLEPPSTASAGEAVSEIVDLMAKTRRHVEQEKKDIESFLSQLTSRLQELDRHLEESVGSREQAAKQGDAIDESMFAEVAGIRKSVNEADDIHQLKGSIQGHLSNIQLHMDARKRLEQDRVTQAEAEIERLKQSLESVQEESSDLHIRLSEASERALHDALTGLSNRLAYDERIAQECERWERYGRPTVLSIWDVDHFKKINDTYGHSAGDNVLRALGQLLGKHTRKSDFIARFGGEEFMLLLPETDIGTALEVAEKLRALIAASKFMYRGQPVPVTMSCGMAGFIAGDTADDVYRRADTALYEAKQAGRNRCKIFQKRD